MSFSKVREIFSDYDPHFMPASLDEAYLDITEHLEQRKHWSESMRTHYMCDAKKGALQSSGSVWDKWPLLGFSFLRYLLIKKSVFICAIILI